MRIGQYEPIIYINGKGKASDGCSFSLQEVYKYSFLKRFKRLNITWILDFLQNHSSFTEEELKQKILSHRL